MAVQPPALMTLIFILLLALQSELDVTIARKKQETFKKKKKYKEYILKKTKMIICEISVNTDLNVGLFFTQSCCMAPEYLEYRSQVMDFNFTCIFSPLFSV